MKNACAKRAKLLFFIVKYANLWGFCYRRRRGCLSSLLKNNNKTHRCYEWIPFVSALLVSAEQKLWYRVLATLLNHKTLFMPTY